MNTTVRNNPYWGIRSEELHDARRRAHAERAMVVREILAALVSWRRKIDRRAPAEPTLKVVHEH